MAGVKDVVGGILKPMANKGVDPSALADASKSTVNVNVALKEYTKNIADVTNTLSKNVSTSLKGISKDFGDIATNAKIDPSAAKKAAADATSKITSAVSQTGAGLLGVAKSTLDLMAKVGVAYNQIWSASFSSVESGMKAVSQTAISTAGLKGDAASAIGGFMDNMITSFMFIFKENLAYQRSKYAAGAQLGFGGAQEGQAAKIAAQGQAYKSLVGREEALKYTQALTAIGATDSFDKVMGQSLKLAGSLGIDAGAVASLTRDFMSLGMDGVSAGKSIEEQYRKIQYAVRGTTVPVAAVMKGISEGATAARFMNVDVGLLTNTMGVLAKQEGNLSKFGVDFSKQSGTIAKDLASLGQGNDALNMFFGSNMGKENIGMKAWTKGTFGTQTAEGLKAKGGGFEVTGGDIKNLTNSNAMTAQKIMMLKDMMVEETKNITDPDEALFVQKEIAKKIGGVSDSTAIALATTQKSEIGKIAKDPEMANQFKDEKQIWGDMKSIETMNEQNSRRMVAIQMGMFSEAVLQTKILLSSDKDKAKLQELARKNEKAMLDNTMAVFKQMGDIASPAFNMLRDIEYASQSSSEKIGIKTGLPEVDKALEGGRALGGPVTAGEPYIVGEKGPELFMPGNSGTIIPNDKLTSTMNTSQSGDTTHISLTFHGISKDQIMNQVLSAVRSNLI